MTTPSLCSVCSSIPDDFFAASIDFTPKSFSHHRSSNDIVRAAGEGCALCGLIDGGSLAGAVVEQNPQDNAITLKTGRGAMFATFDPKKITTCMMPITVVPEEWEPTGETRSELAIVQDWLRECDQHHTNCNHTEKTFVPTRLVDLGPEDTPTSTLWIQFGTNLAGQPCNYIALSYCWGENMPVLVKTTSANVGDRRAAGFDAAILPPTLRDAISFTRALGIRYVWIDVLCILQDSERDWRTESMKMWQVYSSAYCTLAASASLDTFTGFPKYDFVNQLPDRAVILTLSANAAEARRICIWRRHSSNTFDGILSQSPLQRRGWALQERHVSRRIVHFCQRSLLWECKTHRLDTRLPWHAAYHPKLENRRLIDNLEGPALREFLNHGGWQNILREYSARVLTYEKDRHYAIASLVETVDRGVDDQYLAGHWRSTLPASLCWSADPLALRPRDNRANRLSPTWSWASITGPLIFHLMAEGPIKLLAARVETFHETTLGIRYEGWVRVKGILRALVARTDLPPDPTGYTELHRRNDDQKDGCLVGNALLDTPTNSSPRPQDVVCLAMGRRKGFAWKRGGCGAQMESDRDIIFEPMTALVLIPTSKPGEFQRLGITYWIEKSVFDTCKESIITIV